MMDGLRFNGSEYVPDLDDERLTSQIRRIFSLMKDRTWRTLNEIEEITKDPPASISAQLRHLRKKRFGNHTVNKRIRGDRVNGLYEYQLVITKHPPPDTHVPFDSDIVLSGGKAILKYHVSKARWLKIDVVMRKKGWMYQGNGIWEKRELSGYEGQSKR